MKKAFFTASCFFLLNCQLLAQPLIDYQKRLAQIHDNIYQYFAEPATGLFLETNDPAHNEKKHSYLWPLCALVQAANEMEQVEPSKNYLAPVMKAIAQYHNSNPPAPGYQAYVAKEQADSRFYDDNQWIAIACLDAYNRTKKKTYLEVAQEIYRFMMTGYDAEAGGGLYWKEDEKDTKNTCSNGPGILVALQLYKVTKEKSYLDTALSLYEWTNQHLLSPEGVYYDAIKIPSLRIDSATYTYNTGTMLQANALLYSLTQQKKFLQEAQRIAGAAEKHFYRNHQLPDNYWFNAVLLRGYIELFRIDKDSKRFQFIIDDAERIWREERDARNLLGKHQVKRLIDQAAMLEIYARLQQLRSTGK